MSNRLFIGRQYAGRQYDGLEFGGVAVVTPIPEPTPVATAGGGGGGGRGYVISRRRPPVIKGRGSVRIKRPDVLGAGRVFEPEPDYSQALREDEEFLAAFLLN